MGGSPQFLNWPRTDHQTNTQKDFLHMYWRLMDRAEAIVDRIPDYRSPQKCVMQRLSQVQRKT